jgi:hypothetical protein
MSDGVTDAGRLAHEVSRRRTQRAGHVVACRKVTREHDSGPSWPRQAMRVSLELEEPFRGQRLFIEAAATPEAFWQDGKTLLIDAMTVK